MHKYSLKWWKAQYRQFNSDEFLVALPRMKREMRIKWKILKKDLSNKDDAENIEPIYSIIAFPMFILMIGALFVLGSPNVRLNFSSLMILYIYDAIYVISYMYSIYMIPGMLFFEIPSSDHTYLFLLMFSACMGFKVGIEIPFWVNIYYYRKYRKQKLEEGAREID